MHVVPSRDKYIQINRENINDDDNDDFDKVYSYNLADVYFPYDFESIMHYSSRAKSKNNLPTIVVVRGVS